MAISKIGSRGAAESPGGKMSSAEQHCLFEVVNDGIVSVDETFEIRYVNTPFTKMLGLAASNLLGHDVFEFLDADGRRTLAAMAKHGAAGEHERYPINWLGRDGKAVPSLVSISPMIGGNGWILAVSGASGQCCVDLEREVARLNRAIDSAQDGIIFEDLQGNIETWNKGAERLYGYSAAEMIGKNLATLAPPEHKHEIMELNAAILRGERVESFETVRVSKSGEAVDVRLSLAPIRDPTGAITGIVKIEHDISAYKRAEAKAAAAAAQYAALLATTADGYWRFNADGKILDVNESYCKLSGYTRDELLRMAIPQITTRSPDEVAAIIRKIKSTGFQRFPSRHRRKDGSIVELELSVSYWRALDQFLLFARDVTEQKRAEADLLRASRFSQILFDASLDPLVTVTPEGIITSVNKATEEVAGYTQDELIGTDVANYFTEPQVVKGGFKKALAKGSVRDYALVLRHRSGVLLDVLCNATVYRNDEGETIGIFAAARDVTARMRAEREAEVSARYSRNLIEASLDPLVTISAEGKITDVNKATEEATGYPRGDLIGTDFADYFTESELAKAGYEEAFEKGAVRDYALVLRHRSGAVMDVLYNASVYRDENGKIAGVFAAARDVSARKRAEHEAEAAARYSRNLIEASVDPLVTISAEGKITDVNKATEEATGYSRVELIGTDFADYFSEPELAKAGYEEAFEKGSVRDYALVLRHRSGAVMDVLYNATVYRDETGKVAGVFAAARDVTARRRADQSRARALRAMRMLNTANEIAIHAREEATLLEDTCRAIVDTGGYQLAWVGYAEQDPAKSVRPMAHFGPGSDDFVANTNITWSEEDERGLGPTGTAIRTGKAAISRNTQRDPAYRPWRDYAAAHGYLSSLSVPLQEDGNAYGVLVILSDEIDAFDMQETRLLTELAADMAFATTALRTKAARDRDQKELEQHKMHLEDMVRARTAELATANASLSTANKELETFAYSVSHDLRAPLRAIDGFSHVLLEDYAGKLDEEGRRLLGIVRQNTVRMGQLIDDILAFSRVSRAEMMCSKIDMEALAREVIDEMAPAVAGRKVEFKVGALPPACGDRAMIQRVFENLIDNAIKYTGPKPEAHIEIGATPGEEQNTYFVRDNGVGFDMRYADKLFGVFTRLHGSEFPGNGIGLAIVSRIIARHGGSIRGEGKVNEGATFYFSLPSLGECHA